MNHQSLECLKRKRLEDECAKLDIEFEQRMAEEGTVEKLLTD